MSQKSEIKLSILIPSIPSRWRKLTASFDSLLEKIGDKDIEILAFSDNKKRTIGEKRDALVKMAKGKYIMFVDDDDELISVDEIYEAAKHDVDVITFKQECRNSDGSKYIVDFGLGNEMEHNSFEGNYLDMKRPPFHVCAWNIKYAAYDFPAVNYAEDWGWVKQFVHVAIDEIHIDKVLSRYNFDPEVTEASTESNSEWTNPNIKLIEDEESDSQSSDER
jgi:glycosyltransferase involved in cell wall biosynthesis